jgi:hypothetical protein
MKKLCIILSLLFVGLPVFAQESTYISMLVQENQWNELVKNISSPPEYQYERTYITKLGEIMNIDGVSYYKLKTTRVETSDVWETVGYIREDVELQKVYYKPLEKPEILLYAFDVQTGDVLQSYDIRFEPIEVTVTIDSVKNVLIDHIQRKQVYVSAKGRDDHATYQCNHVWIEGIGNMDGFLRSTHAITAPGDQQYSMQCFFSGDDLMYKNEETGIEDCFVWRYTHTGIIKQEKDTNYIVSQTNNTLSISSQNPIISIIELFDITGKKIYEKRFKSTCDHHSIDTNFLMKNVYILRIFDTNGCISSFKIIKK